MTIKIVSKARKIFIFIIMVTIGSFINRVSMISAMESDGGVESETDIAQSNLLYEISDDGNITITGYRGEKDELVTLFIPDTIDNHVVTKIEKEAFSYCKNLSSVRLPEGLVFLGDKAFYDCDALTEIEIPKGVKNTGGFMSGPFSKCDGLKTAVLQEGMTEIPWALFAECTGLESVTIPDGIIQISWYAFYKCTNLTNVKIPDSVTYIGVEAFADCTNLCNFNLPGKLVKLDTGAFKNCSAITYIIIPKKLKEAHECFIGCSGLKNVLFEDGTTEIVDYLFYGCTGLESIDIPVEIIKIGSSSFYGCTNLKSINMHDGIVEIGDSAFSGCSVLKSIKLPDKITVINDSVFANCKSLANVEIAESVLKIGCSAFSECDAITDINIPCNVTCIESKAFFGCDSLENINFGSNVQTIGSYAFYMCNNLSEIKLPYSIEKIQEAAFGYCKQLTKAVIEKKVNYIARDAFNYPETLIIYGVGGTLAEQYANEIGALFQTIIDMDADTSKYYNVTTNGGSWDGTHYYLPSGQMVRNSFFSEGTYTYYLQADGTPMKDRLTYHPDGVHVIYFDADGHEVFSDFAHISKSIAGADVDDMCFFNVYGYMYVDTLTYDKTGTKLYYVNPYGVLERNGWFQFSGHEFDAGLGFSGVAGGYGYANWDCSLMVNTNTYDWNGNLVYMQGDGHMAQ